MATIQEIIKFTERYYPKSTLVSIEDRVSDLNDLHKDIYITIQKLKNDFEFYEIDSIEDVPIYPLPNRCRINDIVKLTVSTDTSYTKFEEYKYAGLNDDISKGKYYGRAAEGTFFLFSDGLPLKTTGLKIFIYCYPRPNELTADNLSAIPDLDEDYHDLLKFGLIQMLASQGHDPDTQIADHWQDEYDLKMNKVLASIEERYNNAPTRRAEAMERM